MSLYQIENCADYSVEVIPQQVYIRICPCRLRYSFGQIPTCHGISGFRFEACAGEKKSSVGDAHRVFLRVVEIQRRKVRQYSKNLCNVVV